MPDCLFCEIVARTIPATIVRETDLTLAFRDIDPQAPVHVLVIPKAHYPDVTSLTEQDPAAGAAVLRECAEVAAAEGLDGGFRLVFNTGPDAGQAVAHVHAHVLGRRQLSWPPG